MSMSDDEPYDADGDVSRFLHCPSPEAHMFTLSEPEGTLVGLCQYAPATTDEVQGHQAPQTLNAVAPDLLGHQVPTTEFQGLPATQTLNAAPDFGLQQAPVTGFQGHPAPDFGLPLPPAIGAAEHYQPSIMDVDYHQPMAVDNTPPTRMLAAPEMHHHEYGGFPDPTPMHCDGVDEASLHMLAHGLVPDRSPSLCQQVVNDGEGELAAIIRNMNIERGDNAGAALNDVYPVKAEDVLFRQIIGGQLDCSRCRSVREIVAAPPPSHHAHMGLEVCILNNIISAPAATSTAAQPEVTQSTTDAPVVPEAEAAAPEAAQPAVTTAPQQQENTDAPAAEGAEAAAAPQTVLQPAVSLSQKEENKDDAGGAVFAPFNWEGFQPEILESSLVQPYDPESGTNVLLYPSLVEQLQQTELERKESKKLSKMPAQDATTYLQMIADEESANEPKLGSSSSFRRLCQRDSTYRLYSRRVNCINRKMKKLQQTAARVGPRGPFAIRQKMETYKREKAELYDMINKAIQENERGGNNGAGPCSRAGPSNRAAAAPSNECEAGASNDDDAAGPSNTAIPCSNDVAGIADDAAGPSNAAIPSSDSGAGISSNEDAAGPSDTAIVPSSNCAGRLVLPAASS